MQSASFVNGTKRGQCNWGEMSIVNISCMCWDLAKQCDVSKDSVCLFHGIRFLCVQSGETIDSAVAQLDLLSIVVVFVFFFFVGLSANRTATLSQWPCLGVLPTEQLEDRGLHGNQSAFILHLRGEARSEGNLFEFDNLPSSPICQLHILFQEASNELKRGK